MDRRYRSNIFALLIILAIIILAAIWAHGHHRRTATNPTAGSSQVKNTDDPRSYVSWQVPSGLVQARCPGVNGGVTYLLRGGTDTACAAAGPNPILIQMDLQDTTDCNQVKPGAGIIKHTCLSIFIDGHKTLKSQTDYDSSSGYGTDTTQQDYYFNTGKTKAVVLVRYIYSGANSYQSQFDALAQSLRTK